MLSSRYSLRLLSNFKKPTAISTKITFLSNTKRQFCQTAYTRLAALPDTKDAVLSALNQIETKTTASYNNLLKELAEQGRASQAQTVYDNVFRNKTVLADIDTYSQLMLAYINHGEYEEAMGIYYELRDHEDTNKVKDFVLDAKMYATMIRSLTHAKNMTAHLNRFDPTTEPVYAYSVEDDDRAILENIEGDSQPALLTALTLFNDMRRLEIQPSPEMYTSMLKACTEQKDSYVLEKLHKLMRMDLYLDPDVRVLNQLMEAYSVIGDGPSALEIWDTIETSLFNSDSVSIVLKACLDYGYHTRANAIWNAVKLKQPELRLSVDDFNNYLLCVIRSKDMEKAEKLVQEGLANGDADESSVNTLEQYK